MFGSMMSACNNHVHNAHFQSYFHTFDFLICIRLNFIFIRYEL